MCAFPIIGVAAALAAARRVANARRAPHATGSDRNAGGPSRAAIDSPTRGPLRAGLAENGHALAKFFRARDPRSYIDAAGVAPSNAAPDAIHA
jgi:hypothetical protein